MQKFDISGMSCAACSARIEKAVSNLGGVENCSVNLLANTMTVESHLSDDEIIAAVVKAGYGASVQGGTHESSGKNGGQEKEPETMLLRRRLFCSVFILIVLMYFSMGHHMLG